VNFTLEVALEKPKIYYRLDNFYANHRDFVKSRNYKQLRGTVETIAEISTCDPITIMSDLGTYNPGTAFDGVTQLPSSTVANPCGLIAKYFFNDRYQLTDSSGNNVTIDETNIAHSVDTKYKFKSPTDAS
jgi:hypothetical protein